MAIVGGRPTKRWTTAGVERPISLGAIDHSERYDLPNDEVKGKMGQNLPPISGIAGTAEALRAVFGRGFYVATHGPIKGDPRSEPEPDVAVYCGSLQEFRQIGPSQDRLASSWRSRTPRSPTIARRTRRSTPALAYPSLGS